jgi:hypothetical protein
MIANEGELDVTIQRIARFCTQVRHLRETEQNPRAYHLSASGFLTEIERMQLEVREYLSLHPTELKAAV